MEQDRPLRNVDVGLLVVRIALAIVFINHGYPKLFQGGHSQIAQLMASRGAPMPGVLGWLAGGAEFFGGILILAGIFSRLWGLGLVAVMAVAIATVHGKNGFNLQNEAGVGYEYCLTLLLGALAIVLGGAGRLSLDHLVFTPAKNKRGKKPKPELFDIL